MGYNGTRVRNMNNNRGIIEFEDLFKEEIAKRKQDNDPARRGRYRSALITYILVMFAFSSVLFLILSGSDRIVGVMTPEEQVIDAVTFDVQGLAIMDNASFSPFEATYGDYIGTRPIDDAHLLLYNLENTAIDTLIPVLEETGTISMDTLLDVLDGTVTTWPDLDYPIDFYATGDTAVPYPATIGFETFERDISTPTPFGTSVINFLVYLLLLPLLILFLRRELVEDFQSFKTEKSRILPVVLIGYLYLLGGNIISNVLQTLLSGLFSIGISTSYNQIAVIRSIRSDGAALMIISAVLLGPVVEELVFRKSIFGLFNNDKVALVVSSLLFGSVHLLTEESVIHALINGLSYIVLGLVFGLIYIKNNKNIWPPIIVHVISNTIAILGIIFLL